MARQLNVSIDRSREKLLASESVSGRSDLRSPNDRVQRLYVSMVQSIVLYVKPYSNEIPIMG